MLDEKKKEKKESFGFCSHHRKGHIDYYTHTFRLSFKGRDIYLCARCTGIYVAFFSFFIFGIIFGFSFFQTRLNPYLSLFFAVMLVMPLLVDWGTQKLGLRESINPLRFITGFIFGIGFWFIQFTIPIYFWALLTMALYSLAMYTITLIGRKRRTVKVDIKDDID
ncbi:MAG: DUF2085 domain-containing protein [Candidatus Lokiarchaeota archaeon]|nr:DUF2085 domain-containing protein [Candidatus Lokiarchaeota archaeon]